MASLPPLLGFADATPPTPPEPVTPPIDTAPTMGGFALPWTPEDTALWRARIAASDAQLKTVIEEGRKNVRRYTNRFLDPLPANTHGEDRIAVPASFWFLEQ